ncbi:hypothetical protein DRN86_01210 [Candidatus Geothermarchaeota archaeon]|nr:MAG: hypothetical protein DRN86_01210 [Candidatus Geothermarchaeota archaeon]
MMEERSKRDVLIRVLIPIIIFLLIFVLPPPEGLSLKAWQALAMGYAISFGGILTYFSAASSAPWYGLRYLTASQWLKSAIIMEIVLLAIFFGVGIPCWMLMGLW